MHAHIHSYSSPHTDKLGDSWVDSSLTTAVANNLNNKTQDNINDTCNRKRSKIFNVQTVIASH